MRWITLLQQNDIHAQLEPHWEYFWENGRPTYRMAGGLARAATVINEVRAETNGALCLVDGGDAIHGTGPAQWSQGAAIVPALNALGIDLMAPGNWEFGFGPAVLRERAAELRFPLVTQTMPRAFGAGLRMTDGIAQVRQAVRPMQRSGCTPWRVQGSRISRRRRSRGQVCGPSRHCAGILRAMRQSTPRSPAPGLWQSEPRPAAVPWWAKRPGSCAVVI
jgi:hypothetical protein